MTNIQMKKRQTKKQSQVKKLVTILEEPKGTHTKYKTKQFKPVNLYSIFN